LFRLDGTRFSHVWEQRKLGEISDKVKEKNKSREITETLTNSAEHGIINQRDFFDKDISNVKNLDSYYVVRNDDFVYNPRISNFAPVGPIKRNKLGRTGVMSPLYYVFRTHDINKNYLEKYFDTVYWHCFMELNGDSGARADRFAIKDSVFIDMPIPYPSVYEQKKIGGFFNQLDATITLHQRKLELLKRLKQGYLQKMFPKSGEKVPELRFAGFDEEWEQHKLGDLANFSKGKGYTKNDLIEKGSPIILYGRLYTSYETIIKEVDTFVDVKDKSMFSEGNEVVVPASGETAEDISRASVIGKEGIILSGDLNIIKPKEEINSVFLALTISNGPQQKEMTKRAQGKSVVHLHNSDLKQVELIYPSSEEQKKIGVFFEQFDDNISFHQNKINQLKSLKVLSLKKMFV